MVPVNPPGTAHRLRRLPCWLALASALLALGCAGAPPVARERPLVLFPLPPEKPRVQYLGSLSSTADLPSHQSKFAEFLLGPPEVRHPLLKPINALLSGSKLYICDTMLNTVVVYDLVSGDSHVLAGDRGIGKIQQPNNLAIDDEGRLLVADKARGAVLVYGPDERYLHAWGRPGEVAPVAVAAARDVLYVCDVKDHEIEVWDRRTGGFLRSFGGKGNTPGLLLYPTYVALGPDGSVYVTDTGNFRVQKFSPKGEPLMQFGRHGDAMGQFAWPKGLDLDGHGRLYVADARFANVQIFDGSNGRLFLFFGGPGEDRGNLDLPAGLRVCPWPAIPWLTERVMPGFDPEYLVIVVNQWQSHLINFFAVARERAESP